MKKVCINYRIPLTETIYMLLDFPEREERGKGAGSLFKPIMAENFPNPRKELDIQVHETNRSLQNSNQRGVGWGWAVGEIDKGD